MLFKFITKHLAVCDISSKGSKDVESHLRHNQLTRGPIRGEVTSHGPIRLEVTIAWTNQIRGIRVGRSPHMQLSQRLIEVIYDVTDDVTLSITIYQIVRSFFHNMFFS